MDRISPVPTGASSVSYGAASTISEQSNGSVPLQTNNPYLKMQTTGQNSWDGDNSQAIWGDVPGQAHKYEAKYETPVELPAYQTPSTPSHEMRNLGLGDHPQEQNSAPPYQAPLIEVNSPTSHSEHANVSLDANPWELASEERSNNAWQPAHTNTVSPVADLNVQNNAPAVEQLHVAPQTQQTPAPFEEQPPALPPRRSNEDMAPAMPPRPIDTGVGSAAASTIESPNTRMNRQRKEHYQIKQIRWLDHNTQEMRVSPVLTQNLNGPCPLLALVNALVLSTPPRLETALVETLRTRETVSLGLLLDAVFEELMSGRRGDAAQELPDVSELYKFLLALHTGLNVNPMFVPDANPGSGNAALTNRAGAFENTQDMKLYRTFNIPLMHGWLPEAGSVACDAFTRIAPSYETSQFVQFQEEELNTKLASGDSLNEEEQQMFTDIHAIKEFLLTWPTQLSEYGLKVIRDNLQLGQVAILFRNDHFSTLCKNPRNGELVTLVTDQGYSGHDEIVWESLTDVNGQGSQLFSGDFRSVDNSDISAGQPQSQSQLGVDDNQGWTTVQGRRGQQQSDTSQATDTTSSNELSRAEQEDHDLALALQLQEEEEDRQRRETEQRERDARLVANPLSQNPPPPTSPNRRPDQTPTIPPRRNNIASHRPNNEPAPPPLYEEAITTPQYNPPAGHPANPQTPIAQGSAYQATSGGLPPLPGSGGRRPNMLPGRGGRRQSAGPGPGQGQGGCGASRWRGGEG
ncbi:hypothetical protein GMOD_00008947 [Pyrenophora seminiperda CCB06]|uniref:MINDY deubiquitinase domain-containing protein n=1 Tax=Pyrenophora seminiperda CCB06 TaxID=1302712 RepID=A0A3M7MFC9_9PLEO|nr:hypothetical protein GMOD_00008947 [Pyrenophora seminiperda CCB06]